MPNRLESDTKSLQCHGWLLSTPLMRLLLVLIALLLPNAHASGQAREASTEGERPPASLSPMTGVEVTAKQREAMRASWALVADRWNAIMTRSRARGRITDDEHAVLRALADEHNQRLLQILTEEQRKQLEVNLEQLRARADRGTRITGEDGGRPDQGEEVR